MISSCCRKEGEPIPASRARSAFDPCQQLIETFLRVRLPWVLSIPDPTRSTRQENPQNVRTFAESSDRCG
jgi:hypothetical protein